MTGAALDLVTWNMHRGRPAATALANVRALVRDLDPDVVALQETRDYQDVLAKVPHYRLRQLRHPRGADQLAYLVRDDHQSRRLIYRERGDGWTTSDGAHHVATGLLAVAIDDWARLFNVHMPPSLGWPHGRPEGPQERVDDLVAMMRYLAHRGRQSAADAWITDQTQHDRYGSDHPAVSLHLAQRGDAKGLVYLGDWNCRPGRDEGLYSLSWLAERGGMQLPRVKGDSGHLHGIDRAVSRSQRAPDPS